MPRVVTSYDSDGVPQTQWIPYRMPRWPDDILEICFFVFPSKGDAEKGTALGGCGFFVSVPWESDPERSHVYAVTSKHVIQSRQPHVIRAQKIGASSPAFTKAPRDRWTCSEADDLAVMLMDDGWAYHHENFLDRALTQEVIDEYSIGIGDDVFSIGRFVDVRGTITNRPLIRSGVIAAFPEFPVTNRYGAQDSYVVEMRSRSGFSGSPVFAYVYSLTPRFVDGFSNDLPDQLFWPQFFGPWLMGVHWGEITVQGPDTPRGAGSPMLDEDRRGIELGSGMSGVIPCSRLKRFLMEDEKVLRDRRDYEANAPRPNAVEQSAPPTTEDNPSHEADFNRLLDAAARTPKQGGRT